MGIVNKAGPALKRLGRKCGKAMLNAPLAFLGAVMLAAFACYSAGTVLETNESSLTIFGLEIPMGPVEAVFDLGCGSLAFLGFMASSAFASDPRPSQRKRALPAALLASALIFVSVSYLANGFAFERQKADWRAYSGSAGEAADKAIVADPMNDSRVQAEAALRLQTGAKPTRPQAEFGEWVKASALHFLVMLSAGAFRREQPETDAQRKARVDAMEKERRRRKREADKAKRDAELARQIAEERARQGKQRFDLVGAIRKAQ